MQIIAAVSISTGEVNLPLNTFKVAKDVTTLLSLQRRLQTHSPLEDRYKVTDSQNADRTVDFLEINVYKIMQLITTQHVFFFSFIPEEETYLTFPFHFFFLNNVPLILLCTVPQYRSALTLFLIFPLR